MYSASLRTPRSLLLSASTLVLVAASGAPALAQAGAASPTPQPSASPSPEPSAPAQATPQQSAPAPQSQGGTVLPETRVVAPAERARPRTKPPRVVATNRPAAPTPTPPTQEQVVAQQSQKFDAARQTIFPPVGANTFEMSHQAIESLPQGNNATLDKTLLQFPGVHQDSAASGELHVRNEHAKIGRAHV